MLQIGRGQQNVGAVQRKSQVALGDLYQLYTQATRSAGQKAQVILHATGGEYTLTVESNCKNKGAVWQLFLRSKGESQLLWRLETNNVAAVHAQFVVDAK